MTTDSTAEPANRPAPAHTWSDNPWPGLWAMVIGFFMILVDSTIVSVATDAIMVGLGTDLNSVVWVTSAYLLGYVVPLLICGKLGDRFGPRNVYLIGLVIFTAASAWCGFSGSASALITARVVQGIGAAMMTPQTMAVITRTFPPERRGAAMGLWGSAAGAAILVGPLAGGILVDNFGWEWIFFVNVPVGVVALALAWRLVPKLPTHRHRWDVPGILLSGAGLFCIVFGLQEGERYNWGTITGPISVWSLIGVGALAIGVFVWWQSRASEPLMPLRLFADRNFTLANIAITSMGFAVTGMAIPLMLFAQKSMGLTPLRASLLMIPFAVSALILARPVGLLVDRMHPRYLGAFGFLAFAVGLFWIGAIADANVSVVSVLMPLTVMGIGSAFVWPAMSATATRNLPMQLAGTGSAVYNMTRQVGAVLGSAAVGALMQNRIAAHLQEIAGGAAAGGQIQSAQGALPEALIGPFARSMGESIWLPAAILLIGVAAAMCFARPAHQVVRQRGAVAEGAASRG